MKIGILGGTFDPIHLGHLRTAEDISWSLGLEKIFLIPSSYPPHKTKVQITPFHRRLAMARLAAAESPVFEALDLEGRRQGYSYSIETLKELNRKFSPKPELFFILGTDALLEIETWKDYQRLFDYAHFAIVQRAGHEEKNLEPFLVKVRKDIKKTANPDTYITLSEKTVRILTPTCLGISSTHIRQMVAQGRSVRFLVPESVRKYIIDKGLYQNHAVTG